MATELGKAYVQIIPSAKGISGSISNLLNPEASSAGQSAGRTFGSNLAGMVTKVVAAAGIGKALQSTIMEGANLEQSLGGIETLFRDDADKVIKYANEAYRTAGLSANDYMQSVTSFSASLLQSLGGDTEAAAETANMALIDMSDNANKMGTSMQSIQDAYRGFARQNYTMLDNLALGYGGTKTEMERLLADATELSGIEYDINNLDDVYNAIHVIQQEMGITGTTAKEAAETFSGSLAAMKASLSNVMGQMALGQDIKPALNALAETTATFLFDNFLPMIGNILTSLPGAIGTFIQASIPHLKKAGENLMSSLGKSIMSVIPDQLKPLTKQFSKLGEAAQKGLSTLTDGVEEVWSTLSKHLQSIDWGSVLTTVQNTLTQVLQFFRPWINGIKSSLDNVVDLFKGVWDSIKMGLDGDWSSAFDNLKTIVSDFFIGIGENIQTNWAQMWSNVIGLIDGIDWGSVATNIMQAIGNAWSGAVSWLGDVGNTIKEWIFTSTGAETWSDVADTIFTAIGNSWQVVKSSLGDVLTAVRSWVSEQLGVEDSWSAIGQTVMGFIGNAFRSAVSFLGDIVESVTTWLTGQINSINWTSIGVTIGNFLNDAFTDGMNFNPFQGTKASNAIFGGGSPNIFQDLIDSVNNAAIGIFDGLAESMGIDDEIEAIKGFIDDLKEIEFTGDFGQLVTDISDAFTTSFEGVSFDDLLPEFSWGSWEDEIEAFITFLDTSFTTIQNGINAIKGLMGQGVDYDANLNEDGRGSDGRINSSESNSYQDPYRGGGVGGAVREVAGGISGQSQQMTNIISQMQTEVSTGLSTINTTFNTFIANLSGTLTTNGTQWVSIMATVMQNMQATFTSGLNSINSLINRFISQTSGTLTTNGAQWVTIMKSTMTQMQSSVQQALASMNNTVIGGMNRIVATLSSYSNSGYAAGRNLAVSFNNGMASAMGAIISTATSLGVAAANAINRGIDARSPSRKGTASGKNLGGSFGGGIQAMFGYVSDMGEKLGIKGIPDVSGAVSKFNQSLKNIQMPTMDMKSMSDINKLLESPTFRSGAFSFSDFSSNKTDMTETNELLERIYLKNPNLVADDGAILGRYTTMMDRENGIIARNREERRLF